MRFVPKRLSGFVLLGALAAAAVAVAALPAGAAEPVKIQRSIPFASTAQVPPAVRDSCQLQTKVPDFIKQSAGEGVQVVDGALNRKLGRVLEMEITEVHAPGGGAFSGPKWMSVKGELFDHGKSIGSFRAKRFTTGGAFGAFKGTCSIIGRCAKALGEDIAKWLAAPTPNAEIGDAR
jgi:hypothetical protein